MEGFRHVTPITVRFRDVDVMGHVNNAVIFTYLEMARVEYLCHVIFAELDREAAGKASGPLSPCRRLAELPVILAQIGCQFKTPIYFGQKVEVGTRVMEMRNSSIIIQQRIEADGQLAALSDSAVVHYDYQAARSVRIPDETRARVEAFEATGEGE
jgi:acyl-CoA thioester hydrolase